MLVVLKGTAVVVHIDRDIDDWWGISYADIRDGVERFMGQFTSVKVLINSPGGSVTEGMAIRNFFLDLVEQGFQVDMEILGVAASITSVIALSGTSLKMRTGSYIMVHRPYTVVAIDYEEALNYATMLKSMYNDLIDIYMQRVNIEREEIESMVDKETWITAKDAVAMGFAGSVIIPPHDEILNNSNRIIPNESIIWNSFKNVPESLKVNINNSRDEPDPPKETPMDLNEAKTSYPGIGTEVDAMVNMATSGEQKRICALLDLTGGKLTPEVQNIIDNNGDEKDLALLMVKNGITPVTASTAVATTTTTAVSEVAPIVNTQVVPAVIPSTGIKTDAEVVAVADEVKFNNIMNNIFGGKNA